MRGAPFATALFLCPWPAASASQAAQVLRISEYHFDAWHNHHRLYAPRIPIGECVKLWRIRLLFVALLGFSHEPLSDTE
jgi:hypothetical protein